MHQLDLHRANLVPSLLYAAYGSKQGGCCRFSDSRRLSGTPWIEYLYDRGCVGPLYAYVLYGIGRRLLFLVRRCTSALMIVPDLAIALCADAIPDIRFMTDLGPILNPAKRRLLLVLVIVASRTVRTSSNTRVVECTFPRVECKRRSYDVI